MSTEADTARNGTQPRKHSKKDKCMVRTGVEIRSDSQSSESGRRRPKRVEYGGKVPRETVNKKVAQTKSGAKIRKIVIKGGGATQGKWQARLKITILLTFKVLASHETR